VQAKLAQLDSQVKDNAERVKAYQAFITTELAAKKNASVKIIIDHRKLNIFKYSSVERGGANHSK
jgi:hypothetical protein